MGVRMDEEQTMDTNCEGTQKSIDVSVLYERKIPYK